MESLVVRVWLRREDEGDMDWRGFSKCEVDGLIGLRTLREQCSLVFTLHRGLGDSIPSLDYEARDD
jgi:hypothetical protein